MMHTETLARPPKASAARLFPLSREHRRYMLLDFTLGSIPNAVISGVAAYFIFRHLATVPLWGGQGIAFDFVATVFLVTLVQLTVCTSLTRKRVRAGDIRAIDVPRDELPVLRVLPHNVVLRGILMGIAATAVLVPLSIVVMLALGVEALPLGVFVAFKACYGPAVGSVTAPIVYLAALTDQRGGLAAQRA